MLDLGPPLPLYSEECRVSGRVLDQEVKAKGEDEGLCMLEHLGTPRKGESDGVADFARCGRAQVVSSSPT